MDPVKDQFTSLLGDKGISISDEAFTRFERYYQLLVEWNERMNLTAITDRGDVYIKHFYDSLSLSFFYDVSNVGSMADIGSGAGFPSLPLKVLFPHIKVTIIDSLNKRITFLEEVVRSLELDNVSLVHGRAEDFGNHPQYREQFDLVTARAVAKLNVLSEFCLPFTRVGGSFIAMKGAKAEEEIIDSKKAIQVLGGKLKDTFSFTLPLETSSRQLIVISKERNTPIKFPRKAGTPLKTPLI
jgi:16S rRNA (guanine527-N7)-methyltransferase